MDITNSTIDIKLKRLDRVYKPNEKVEGVVNINAKKGWQHNGVNLVVEGLVYLCHSNRGFVGIGLDPNAKPIHILKQDINLSSSNKVPEGVTEIPFEFFISPLKNQTLYESYHGVYISIVYNIQAICDRGVMKKSLVKDLEFLVEIPSLSTSSVESQESSISFQITPESLENVNSKILASIPKFSVSGKLYKTKCSINQPLTGEITIELSAAPIKTLELQLVRIETVNSEGRQSKEATEVQTIQIGDGNICRNLSVPIYMVFPRLFSCPTLNSDLFKIGFEINLILVYGDGYMITENFPIQLFRI